MTKTDDDARRDIPLCGAPAGANDMSTSTRSADSAQVEAFRRRFTRPIEIVIDDAEAYWLGDLEGRVLSAESDRTVRPFAAALEHIEAGTDPSNLVVWARLTDGSRYEVGSGVLLVGMARRSAGIPA